MACDIRIGERNFIKHMFEWKTLDFINMNPFCKHSRSKWAIKSIRHIWHLLKFAGQNYTEYFQCPIDKHKFLYLWRPSSDWNSRWWFPEYRWSIWFSSRNMWCFPLKIQIKTVIKFQILKDWKKKDLKDSGGNLQAPLKM